MEQLKSPIPLYYQLKNIIQQKIDTNEWEVGTAIPGERDLENIYNLSRTPVRQAIGELVNEGVLERRHGKGTFVVGKRIKQTTTRMIGLVEGLYQQGLDPKLKLIAFKTIEAPYEVTKVLNLPENTKMIYACRKIYVGDEILLVDENYFSLDLAPVITKENFIANTVFEIIEKCGLSVTKGSQTFSANCLTSDDAELLEVEAGSPALFVKTLVHGLGDIPLNYSISKCRADRYEHEILLGR